MGTFKVEGDISSEKLLATKHIKVGSDLAMYNSARAEVSVVTSTDNPGELWLGSNGARIWSISARGSSENNVLQVYNRLAAANAMIISNDNKVNFYQDVTAPSFIGSLSGNASTATKLATARTIRTNLASTSTASFDGSSNITPGVTGTLPVANGGTGATSLANITAGLIYNVTETNPTSATRYNIPFFNTGNAASVATTSYTVRTNVDFNALLLQGTASAVGYSILELGNNTASGTAGNKYGMVRLYSESSGYANICAAKSTGSTTHYLPTTGGTIINSAGGTITGTLNFSTSNQYYDHATQSGGAIALTNGDIGGVNSIYFKDAANSVGEGLMFYHSATTVDSLRAYNGVLYFSPNYDSAAGTQDGTYTVVHSGNYTSYQVNTDTKVQQSRSTSTNWRPLLSHYTATTQGTNPEAATNVVYYNEKASIQPSTGKIYSAGGFIGNASTATKLATARTISLTGSVTGSGSFDGSGNLSIATTTNHSHSYVPLSGGTMSGQLSISINSPGTSPSTQHIILNGQNGSTAVANAPGLAMHIGNQNWSTLKFLYDGSWRFYNASCNGYMPIYCSKTVVSNYGSTLPSSGATGEVFYKI